MIVYFSTKSHSNLYPFFDSMMNMTLNGKISHAFIASVTRFMSACLLAGTIEAYVFMLVVFRMGVSSVIKLDHR